MLFVPPSMPTSEAQEADTTPPVVTVPQVTLDQWGNKVIELTMSGTTNFPTATWSVSATDNVGVTNGPGCWRSQSSSPWDSATQSYDFTGVTNPSGTQFPIGSTSIQCVASDAAGNNVSYYFTVKVTHDDPTGLVQISERGESPFADGDGSVIFASPSSQMSFSQLKPIADLITSSNAYGMIARDVTRTLELQLPTPIINATGTFYTDGTYIQIEDYANQFYAIVKRCYVDGNNNINCQTTSTSANNVPKPLADLVTASNMQGMWERDNPDRTWTVGAYTITVSENFESLKAEIEVCQPLGGGTSCTHTPILKPFADMLTSSNFNAAMFDRTNLRLVDAGGPAASAPESEYVTPPTDTTPPVVTLPPLLAGGFTISATDSSGAFLHWIGNVDSNGITLQSGGLYQLIVIINNITATDNVGIDTSYDNIAANQFLQPQGVWCNNADKWDPLFQPQQLKFPIGTTTITCTAKDTSGNPSDDSASFTVTVEDQAEEEAADTTPPTINFQGFDDGMVHTRTALNSTGYSQYWHATPTEYQASNPLYCQDGSETITPLSNNPAWSNRSYVHLFPVGTTTVTCTTTDAAGNTGTASFTMIVTPPTDTTPTSNLSWTSLTITSSGGGGGIVSGETAHFEATLALEGDPPTDPIDVSSIVHHNSGSMGTAMQQFDDVDISSGTVTLSWDHYISIAWPLDGQYTVEFSVAPYAADNTITATSTICDPSTMSCEDATNDNTPPTIIFGLNSSQYPNPSWNNPSFEDGMVHTRTALNSTGYNFLWYTSTTLYPALSQIASNTSSCQAGSETITGIQDHYPNSDTGQNVMYNHLFPVGTTTVTCAATNTAGNTGTASFTVIVTESAEMAAAAEAAAAAAAEAAAEEESEPAAEEEIVIPEWVKFNAGWWDDGLIDDRNYVTGLQWLISNGIMTIPSTEQGSGSDDVIPSWVKNNARWWADGSIDDRNYVTGLQWLITNGVMIIG